MVEHSLRYKICQNGVRPDSMIASKRGYFFGVRPDPVLPYFYSIAVIAMFFLVVFCGDVFAADVSASIDGTSTPEGDPIKGTITITHNRDETIDPATFLVGNSSIAAEKLKDVEISPASPTILTIYKFQINGEKAGLHVLPSVSVMVAGKRYSSLSTTYNVEKIPELQTAPSSTSGVPGSEIPVLRLEASIDGPNTLYPTQRTRLVYIYFFNKNIDLTTEKLPLLDATGLVKIGEKQLRDAQEGEMTAREIAQEVEASVPGTYTFGPSTIAGYAYTEDASGKLSARSELMKSEAPPVQVVVLPFPAESKPLAFNGAVGDFTFSAGLQGKNDVDVGNDLSLVLHIKGKGNLESVPLPDVCCQPGFVGMFRVSDLPPTVTIKGDTKTAIISIKPLTSAVKQIPPISFSFFNPERKLYVTQQSEPIPILVKGVPPKPATLKSVPKVMAKPKPTPEPAPITLDLATPSLTPSDLRNNPFGTWWSLFIVPFGIAFVGYQIFLRNFLRRRKELLGNSSVVQLRAAKAEGGSSSRFFELLTGALKRRLYEANLIPSENVPHDQWRQEGMTNEVAIWLQRLEELRFSGKSSVDIKSLEKDVDGFFAKIPVVPVTSLRDLLAALAPALLFPAAIGLYALFAAGPWFVGALHVDARLTEAQTAYAEAHQAPNLYEKQAALLQAANLYESLRKEYGPDHGSGQLDMALGSLYGDLGSIPTAIWHTRKAAALRPRDPSVHENLEKLQKVLYLDKKTQIPALLSVPEWLQLFFFLSLAAIFICSCAAWAGSRWMKWIIKPVVVCMLLAAVPLIYYRYFSPLYGTVVTSSNLQAGPGETFPRIGQVPVASGSNLEVVGLADEGKWLQVFTPEGANGYVPSGSLRL